MSQLFRLLESTPYLFILYLGVAVVLSDSHFHRVWSLALYLLSYLTVELFGPAISASKTPLAILALAIFAICIALSPVQLLFPKSIGPKNKALEFFSPESGDYSIEFVLPFF